ncbi:S8 family serine peptidase [Actinoallomurus soli]|uniref:S8 family serine peptidase n=1 Tax=Actinoallomurus soli TaxID=2952535 RepID=UPI0020928FC7|nr:S8 family serine peptidase [Actinoallomurus soli]MCO5971964.1 S8 family serine peptidase [Actinoallomurus soli]
MEVLRRALAAGLALTAALLPALPSTAHADAVRDREQWVLDALGAPQAWRTTKGKGVTVAVLDTGIDGSHRDLSGAVTTGPDFIRSVAHDPGRLHGTWMGSLIAGHGHGKGGGDGVIGVAPEAHLLSVRMISDPGEKGYKSFRDSLVYRSALAKAVRYAADHGADVINMSLGGPRPGTDERDAMAYAISKGVVLVASAGNDGDSKSPSKIDKDGLTRLSYPAAFPGVIAVAAMTRQGVAAKFSDRNASVQVAAPGADVIGAGPGNLYWIGEGTSQAGALVSGVAALIRARYHDMPPALVAQAITASTRARPAAGYDEKVGFGEVNAPAALAAADRLQGYRLTAGGKTGRFGDGPMRPVQVEQHPPGLVILGGWVGVAALFGFAGALTTTVLYVRRVRVRHDSGDDHAG